MTRRMKFWDPNTSEGRAFMRYHLGNGRGVSPVSMAAALGVRADVGSVMRALDVLDGETAGETSPLKAAHDDLMALAEALCRADESWHHHDQTDDFPCLSCRATAANLFASDWLAEHVRRARAEALREAERVLAAKAMEWEDEYNATQSDADYGRWDGWANARRFVRHLRKPADVRADS